MNWLGESLLHAAEMAWETFWALVLGFGVSAGLQVFVRKDQMGRLFGHASLRSVALATGFGAASSSCSYAAAAAARSALSQGAAFIPALAFMFASTNLVIELGAVLWILMGWRFVLAEVVGAFVLIGCIWALARWTFPRDLEDEARRRAAGGADEKGGGCHHQQDHDSHAEHEGQRDHEEEHSCHDHDPGAAGVARWRRLAGAFIMDWQMLWKEIGIGFLIAGFLSVLVPPEAWKALFLTGGPGWVRTIENAVVGPLIAMASFVCSVGNIPLASLLWSGGISFGGVISFIYADLIIVPLILIYRKYYGGRVAAYLTGAFFVSMAVAGIVVDLLFGTLGWIPTGPRPLSALEQMNFRWNYTSWLDLAALAVFAVLFWLHRSRPAVATKRPPRPGSVDRESLTMPADLLAATTEFRAREAALAGTRRKVAAEVAAPRIAWWLWPHLLGLDAPAVAVAWQAWWGYELRVRVHPAQTAILGLGVWWIYLCDRLADTREVSRPDLGTARHAFAQRRRYALTPLAATLAATLAVLAPSALPVGQFVAGLGLLAVAGGYFWIIHRPSQWRWTAVLPKEAAVGAMFAVGTALFPLCQRGSAPSAVLAAIGGFGAICFLNCALITTWERNLRDQSDPASLLNAFPWLAGRGLGPLCWGAAGAALLADTAWHSDTLVPIVIGAAGLGLLHRLRRRLSIQALRVLADAVLLGPLAVYAWRGLGGR